MTEIEDSQKDAEEGKANLLIVLEVIKKEAEDVREKLLQDIDDRIEEL